MYCGEEIAMQINCLLRDARCRSWGRIRCGTSIDAPRRVCLHLTKKGLVQNLRHVIHPVTPRPRRATCLALRPLKSTSRGSQLRKSTTNTTDRDCEERVSSYWRIGKDVRLDGIFCICGWAYGRAGRPSRRPPTRPRRAVGADSQRRKPSIGCISRSNARDPP